MSARRAVPKSALLAAVVAAALLAPLAALPQTIDDLIVDARDAARKRDRSRLAAMKIAAGTAGHPLAQWVDYWELGGRLAEVDVQEVEAFYARWPGTYVEDRLRNDWLLELGHRRDWANFTRDMPRFRMNDDREVTCYELLTQHLAGQDARAAARAAWAAQRDVDEGCNLLASTLFDADRFKPDDAWHVARIAAEFNRPRVARAAAGFVDPRAAQSVGEIFDNPARWLAKKGGHSRELVLLALMRMAANDPDAAAGALSSRWQRGLTAMQAALAWATVGKQSALKLQPDALDGYRRAWRLLRKQADPGWTDDMLAWQVRAALRSSPNTPDRWPMAQRAIDAMTATEQREPAWVYWKARALVAQAPAGEAGDAARASAKALLESIAGQLHFYGRLATEELGGALVLPPAPQPLQAPERDAARGNAGFARALQLISIGLRNEGVREWNFMLRGMADRELLAAAQLACEREIWDRCINTSDRTRAEVDLAQRFPMPFRAEVVAKTREVGVDPAYVYGLIRQESRFVIDARSSVGASGLMQLMPATARWTAKKIGLDYRPEMIADRGTNLLLGASYLKLILDDFGGSQALAAAAYNAGPARSRRWREGGPYEAAAWAESIPFSETRDYVKKVLSNAVVYSALLGGPSPSLKARLGATVGPRDASAAGGDKEIP